MPLAKELLCFYTRHFLKLLKLMKKAESPFVVLNFMKTRKISLATFQKTSNIRKRDKHPKKYD